MRVWEEDMNRALGFGIVAAGGLPMLVADASPAAAHGGQSLSSAQGVVIAVTAIGDPSWHHSLLIQDTNGGDGVLVRGEYTLVDGTKGGLTAPQGGITQTNAVPKHNQITAMRKCQIDVPAPKQCSDWVGV
jgi:hypothetical protein